MKKLFYLSFLLVLLGLISSCSKTDPNIDLQESLLKAKKIAITERQISNPTSDNGVAAYIIPGANNGGNRTCAEVGLEFVGDPDYFSLCGDRINYEETGWDNEFPDGLNVSNNGIYISFSIDGCVEINGSYYKVGAVIVKGSNNANVYFYEGGTLGDSGLAAPGEKSMVSNLTFCFIECQQVLPELVVSLKSYMSSENDSFFWTVTRGIGTESNTYRMGFIEYSYNETNSYELYKYGVSAPAYLIGSITISDYIDSLEGIHYIQVAINPISDDCLFMDTFLYVGSANGYLSYLTSEDGVTYSTEYENFPYFDEESSPTKIFRIDIDTITE